MTMRIFKVGLILSGLVLVGGCANTSRRPAYTTPPAIVQQTPIQPAPCVQPPAPIPVQNVPPGAIVVPGPPPSQPQPFVPH